MLRIKRAYEPAARADGYRVLVERLWPRGVRKDDAHLDAWLKDIAPSDGLRKWFGHDPTRFREFRTRYKRELRNEDAQELLEELARRAARERVTLVYSAHDEENNNAVVLADELERRMRSASTARDRSKRLTRTRRAAPNRMDVTASGGMRRGVRRVAHGIRGVRRPSVVVPRRSVVGRRKAPRVM